MKLKSFLLNIFITVIHLFASEQSEDPLRDFVISCRYIRQEQFLPYTESGVFVHLTRILPGIDKDYIRLEPGCLLNSENSSYIRDGSIFPTIRPTIHLTINKSFDEHHMNDFTFPYAILMPTGFVDKSRIHTGYFEDVMIIGPVVIRPGSLVLVKESDVPKVPYYLKQFIKTYPEEMDIRAAVDIELSGYYGQKVAKSKEYSNYVEE